MQFQVLYLSALSDEPAEYHQSQSERGVYHTGEDVRHEDGEEQPSVGMRSCGPEGPSCDDAVREDDSQADEGEDLQNHMQPQVPATADSDEGEQAEREEGPFDPAPV